MYENFLRAMKKLFFLIIVFLGGCNHHRSWEEYFAENAMIKKVLKINPYFTGRDENKNFLGTTQEILRVATLDHSKDKALCFLAQVGNKGQIKVIISPLAQENELCLSQNNSLFIYDVESLQINRKENFLQIKMKILGEEKKIKLYLQKGVLISLNQEGFKFPEEMPLVKKSFLELCGARDQKACPRYQVGNFKNCSDFKEAFFCHQELETFCREKQVYCR